MKKRKRKVEIPRDVLIQLYVVEELTQAEIARRFGVCADTIGSRLSECGIEIRSKVEIPKEALIQLYVVEQLPQEEIAQRFGVDRKTIGNWLVRYGIEARRQEYMEIPKEILEHLYYEEGLTQKQIAERLGTNEDAIRKRMKEYGLKARGGYVEIPREELERLYYQEGWTQEQIAEKFGVNMTTISNRMVEYGMETRNVGNYKKVEISREELERLYYEEGLTQAQIGEKYGVSGATIKNRMAEFGMETRGHWDYVYIDIPKEELYRLYVEQEMSAPEIAQIYGCATSVVYRRMQEHGIEVRPGGWDKQIVHVPSERLEWSPEFAYIVGLITSDGGLKKEGNEVKFVSTDRELIEIYCRLLNLRPDDVSAEEWGEPDATEVHVLFDPRPEYDKPDYRIAFSDPLYRARMEEIGLTPRKSNTLGPLNIPDEFFADFLRGEFDGDGGWHIVKGTNSLRGYITSGSSLFRKWLLESIQRLVPIQRGFITGNNVCFNDRIGGMVGQYMYYAPGLPSLSRKRVIWEGWMERRR